MPLVLYYSSPCLQLVICPLTLCFSILFFCLTFLECFCLLILSPFFDRYFLNADKTELTVKIVHQKKTEIALTVRIL